jgi:hypothetical protein
MSGKVLVFVALLLVPSGRAISAQTDGEPKVFTRNAIARAVSGLAVDTQTPAGAGADWSEVRKLPPGTQITISVSGRPLKTYEFVQADETSLTAIDRAAPGRPTQRIQRDQITEISRLPERRRAIISALIGAGAGAFLAVGTSISLATRDCGGDCTDEKVLIGVSLAGMPTAGGFLGYWLGGGYRGPTTIYRH